MSSSTDAPFEFSTDNLAKAKAIIAKYPTGRQQSAVLPLLDLAQRQNGWVSPAIVEHVAAMLDMAPIRVQEVATFYTMYNHHPVGKHHVQVCTNLPCQLRGADEIVAACVKHLGVGFGETTPDGLFTLAEAECLGACVNAPMAWVGDDYYEDLDPENVVRLLDALKRGDAKPGSQIGRLGSAPEGGPTTLKELASAKGES
jgi:NADH-quinone oxidoreductase subunit E